MQLTNHGVFQVRDPGRTWYLDAFYKPDKISNSSDLALCQEIESSQGKFLNVPGCVTNRYRGELEEMVLDREDVTGRRIMPCSQALEYRLCAFCPLTRDGAFPLCIKAGTTLTLFVTRVTGHSIGEEQRTLHAEGELVLPDVPQIMVSHELKRRPFEYLKLSMKESLESGVGSTCIISSFWLTFAVLSLLQEL